MVENEWDAVNFIINGEAQRHGRLTPYRPRTDGDNVQRMRAAAFTVDHWPAATT